MGSVVVVWRKVKGGLLCALMELVAHAARTRRVQANSVGTFASHLWSGLVVSRLNEIRRLGIRQTQWWRSLEMMNTLIGSVISVYWWRVTD